MNVTVDPKDISKLRRQADATVQHSRQCKKPIDGCKHCQSSIAWFNSLPLPVLALVLEDRPNSRAL